jgi:hypothetical protein
LDVQILLPYDAGHARFRIEHLFLIVKPRELTNVE